MLVKVVPQLPQGGVRCFPRNLIYVLGILPGIIPRGNVEAEVGDTSGKSLKLKRGTVGESQGCFGETVEAKAGSFRGKPIDVVVFIWGIMVDSYGNIVV